MRGRLQEGWSFFMWKSKQVGTAVGVAQEELLQKQTTNAAILTLVSERITYSSSAPSLWSSVSYKRLLFVHAYLKILSTKPVFKPRLLSVIITINKSKLYYLDQTQGLKNCVSESPKLLHLPLKNIISDTDYISKTFLFYIFYSLQLHFPLSIL